MLKLRNSSVGMNKILLNQNIFYIPSLALRIHDVNIISDEGKYLLFDDHTAKICYILLFDINVDIDALMEIAKKYEPTISVVSLFDLTMKDYGFVHHLKTRQYTYEGSVLPINATYLINDVTMDDLPYLAKHYYRIGRDETYIEEASMYVHLVDAIWLK